MQSKNIHSNQADNHHDRIKMAVFKERTSPEKIFHSMHQESLTRFLEGQYKEIKPINAEFHPTMACNWNCNFCNTKNVFGSKSLKKGADEILQSSADAEWIANEFANIGLLSINISGGGEPLINKYTPDLIDQLKKQNIQVGLVSNGYGINSGMAARLLEGCTWIRFSINGNEKGIFDSVNGVQNGYAATMAAMGKIIKVKKEIGSSCVIGLNYVITELNYMDAYSFAALTKKIGFNFVGYKMALPGLDKNGPPDPVINETEKQIDRALIDFKDDAFDVFPFHIERFNICDRKNKVEYPECPMAYFFIVIRPNGDIVPCTHLDFVKEGLNIQNLKKISLVDFITFDQRFEMIRALGKNYKCFKSCQFDRRNVDLDFARNGGKIVYRKRPLIYEIPEFL